MWPINFTEKKILNMKKISFPRVNFFFHCKFEQKDDGASFFIQLIFLFCMRIVKHSQKSTSHLRFDLNI